MASKKESAAQVADRILKHAELWQDEQGNAFITTDEGDNIKVESSQMNKFIYRLKPDGSNTTRQNTRELLSARAIDAPTYHTFKRISNKYLDLGTDYIELRTLKKVHKIEQKFLRNSSMGQLPEPDFDGELSELTDMLPNIRDEDKPLLQGAIVSAFRPDAPHFILVLGGSAGSAKTTTQRMIISCIDPRSGDWDNQTSIISRDPRDLDAAALSRFALSIDNTWTLSETLSNRLAVFATGGEILSRLYYTNDEARITRVVCPVFINGIGEIVTRPDLLTRSIIINCQPIEHAMLSEVIDNFYRLRPRILGGILKHVKRALDNPTKAIYGDRMLEAVSWVVSSGVVGFENAYQEFLHTIDEKAIEMSTVGTHLITLITKWQSQDVNAKAKERQSQLREYLGLYIPEACYITTWGEIYESRKGEPDWPRTEIAFHNARERIRQNLRNLGYDWTVRTTHLHLNYVILGNLADVGAIERK